MLVGGLTYLGLGDEMGDVTLGVIPSTGVWGTTTTTDPTYDATTHGQDSPAYAPLTSTQAAKGTKVKLFSVQPAKAGSSTLDCVMQDQTFNAINDPILFLGWNTGLGSSGMPTTAGEPAWYMGLEQDAFDTNVNKRCEWYINYDSADASIMVFRPIYIGVKRDNVNTDHAAVVAIDIGTDAGTYPIFQVEAGLTNLFTVVPTKTSVLTGILSIPTGTIQMRSQSAGTNTLLDSLVTGDGVVRFVLEADGSMYWGDGTNAQDIHLYRSTASTLTATGAFTAQATVTGQAGASTAVKIGAAGPASQSGISFQNGEAGSNLYRASAGVIKTDGALVIGTRPAFVTGDKYLVADSSGNVHVSGLGPAS